MHGFKGLTRLLAGLSVAALFALATTAQADPVFGLAGASGSVGSHVSLRLAGNVNKLFAGFFDVTFDDAFLSYEGTSPGDFPTEANVSGGLATVTVNPFAPGADLGIGPNFDYFDLLFFIKPGALGSTTVNFGGSLFFGPDGDDESVVTGLTAAITVLDAVNGVPIGSTGPLVLSALALLALTRRRAAARLRPAGALLAA